MAAPFEVIVIGGGLAGLSASMKLAELGATVKIFSVVPVKRSHSVCAQAVSYTHLRAHETVLDLVCRLLLEKKN
mgnify:CR=1 FL=1